MRPAAERLADDLARIHFGQPQPPIVTNVTADVLEDVQEAPALLTRQVTVPVRWVETLQRLQALGVTRFLEFGSGKVLTGLAKRTLGEVEALAVTDLKSLEEALR